MRQIPMGQTHGGPSANVFSPDSQYREALGALTPGTHEMVLRAHRNALFEDEIACFIDGAKVGILHEEQTEYYHPQLTRLERADLEAVTPCQIADWGGVTFHPYTEEHLAAWVDAALAKESPDDDVDGADTPDTKESQQYSIPALDPLRVGRQVMKLASLEWFSPEDADRLEGFALAPVGYEAMGLADRLTRKQEDALAAAGYALHRVSSEKLDYRRTLTVSGTDTMVQAIVIDDTALARFVLNEATDIDSIITRILDGTPLETGEEPVETPDEDELEIAAEEEVLAPSTKQLFKQQRASVVNRRARVAALVNEGMTLGKITEQLQVSYQTIRNDIKALGLSDSVVDGRTTRWSGRGEEIITLVRSGKGINDVCTELGITEAQVWKALKTQE